MTKKGKELEEIINQTIFNYSKLKVALFTKAEANVIVLQKINNKQIRGIINKKGISDYFGVYNGLYIEFEAKQTIAMKFSLNQIKDHQLARLYQVSQHQGISFIVLYFISLKRFFILTLNMIEEWLALKKSKQIPFAYFQENALEIFIDHNMNLDLITGINHLLTN